MYLYLGDGDMTGAAAYLSGIMLHHGIPFERIDSKDSPPNDFCSRRYQGYILSDYPRNRFKEGQLEHLCQAVAEGSGVLMIGGWESYHGQNGEYHDSPLAEVLPVKMLRKDDRRNFVQPAMVSKVQSHPILKGLPWNYPPFIGGLNQFKSKRGTHTLLKAFCAEITFIDNEDDDEDENEEGYADCPKKGNNVSESESRFMLLASGGTLPLRLTDVFPLLVVGTYGRGRTAALATDVAPHWVGGFVDWGKQRMTQRLPTGEEIEVGADYAQFFAQLVQWVGLG